jgi:hypothetical protein
MISWGLNEKIQNTKNTGQIICVLQQIKEIKGEPVGGTQRLRDIC